MVLKEARVKAKGTRVLVAQAYSLTQPKAKPHPRSMDEYNPKSIHIEG
jgi:hypothetical protein